MEHLKNLPVDCAEELAKLVSIKPGHVVSMALSKSEHCQMTLLAFSEGESVSEESYFGDTLYYVLEGEMPVRTESETNVIKTGECMAVPANVLHAVGGTKAFKVLQITVR